MNELMFNDNETTKSLGRNGEMTTVGVVVTNAPEIRIAPINSRLEEGRCYIHIPETQRKRFARLFLTRQEMISECKLDVVDLLQEAKKLSKSDRKHLRKELRKIR